MAVYFDCAQCGQSHGIPVAIREQDFDLFRKRFALHPEFHSLFCPKSGRRVPVHTERLSWREARQRPAAAVASVPAA